MPADSNFPDMPTSPIRDDDKFIVNRSNVSHKINASDLLYYLANVDFPVSKPCDDNADCPPGFTCFNGYCVSMCDGGAPCPEGYICVDPDGLGNQSYCIQYPFPCDSLPGPDPCPPGHICYEGFCFKLCDNPNCPGGTCCPEGTICAYFPNIGESVCIPYPFPCDEEQGCPPGYYCWNGNCIQLCGGSVPGTCPEGSDCLIIDLTPDGNPIYGCVPAPFPCGQLDQYPDPCPDGYYCFGGLCYRICDSNNPCPDGFECVDVGNDGNNINVNGGAPISICMPTPSEGLINDGKLCIVDDQNDIRIIFTANQYGDTSLKFNGIDIEGPDGGGSGTELTFKTLWKRVDPENLESDIQPTYENVNALPNGLESNIGFNDGTQWKAIYANSLRNVSTSSDHLATGTSAQRPTTEPEGNPIGAGEVRYSTDRATYPQTENHRNKGDFEVFNGDTWVRMRPEHVRPLYDDNNETRLLYNRGLTVSSGTPMAAGHPLKNFNPIFGGDTNYLEPHIGRGLRFNPDTGAIEQYSNQEDDILVWHEPWTRTNEASEAIPAGANNSMNIQLNVDSQLIETIRAPIPDTCNRAVMHIAYRLMMEPGTAFPQLPYVDVNHPSNGSSERANINWNGDRMTYSHGRLDTRFELGGPRNVRDFEVADPAGQLRIGFNFSGDFPWAEGRGETSVFWATKVANLSFDKVGNDPNAKTEIELKHVVTAASLNCNVYYNVFRIVLQPYEFQI